MSLVRKFLFISSILSAAGRPIINTIYVVNSETVGCSAAAGSVSYICFCSFESYF